MGWNRIFEKNEFAEDNCLMKITKQLLRLSSPRKRFRDTVNFPRLDMIRVRLSHGSRSNNWRQSPEFLFYFCIVGCRNRLDRTMPTAKKSRYNDHRRIPYDRRGEKKKVDWLRDEVKIRQSPAIRFNVKCIRYASYTRTIYAVDVTGKPINHKICRNAIPSLPLTI